MIVIDHLLYVLGLTALGIAVYTEVKTEGKPSLRPQASKLYKHASALAGIALLAYSVMGFFIIKWYLVIAFLILSQIITALFWNSVVQHRMHRSPEITYICIVIGIISCAWAYTGLSGG